MWQTPRQGLWSNGVLQGLSAGGMTKRSGLAKPSKRSAQQALRRRLVTKERLKPVGRLSYLESRSVRPATLMDYQSRMQQMIIWLGCDPCLMMNLTALDEITIEYLEDLYEAGKAIDAGIPAVAALKFFHPLLEKGAIASLPRTTRALKGWGLAAPQRQRLPIPLEGLGAIIRILVNKNLKELALRLFIQFSCYLRPGECSNLRCKQLIPPQPTAQAGLAFLHWAILLHPFEDGEAGKTNIFDATVLLDSDSWLDPLLRNLVGRKQPDESLWSSPHSFLNDQFLGAISDLGLTGMGWGLYNLRHGGATHDVLSRRRSMLEVKQRGRWAVDASLRRYVKQARMQSELSKLPANVKEFGSAVIRSLPDLLSRPHAQIGLPNGMNISRPECGGKAKLSRHPSPP